MSEITRIGDGTISIEPAGEHGARRVYRYDIRARGWQFAGTDLEIGPGEQQAPVQVLADFLREASHRQDLEHMFPARVRAWAAENYDELSVLAAEDE